MKLVSERSGVAFGHGSFAGLSTPQRFSSAPFGGLKTVTSPRSGSPKRTLKRFTSTRCPTASVGTMDSLGILNGLTRNAWMPRASPSATATIVTSSISEPTALWSFFLRATRTVISPARTRRRLGPGLFGGLRLGVLRVVVGGDLRGGGLPGGVLRGGGLRGGVLRGG